MKIVVDNRWVCAKPETKEDCELLTAILCGWTRFQFLALHQSYSDALAESLAEELRGDLMWLNDDPAFWGISVVPEELRLQLIVALRGGAPAATLPAPQAPQTFSHCQSCRFPYPYGDGPRECQQCSGLRAVFS